MKFATPILLTLGLGSIAHSAELAVPAGPFFAPNVGGPQCQVAEGKPNETVVAPVVEPAARELLDKSVLAYKALESFSSHFVSTNTLPGETEEATTTVYSGDLSFKRPNQIRLEVKTDKLYTLQVADGKDYYHQEPEQPAAYYHSADSNGSGFRFANAWVGLIGRFDFYEMISGTSLLDDGIKWESVVATPGSRVRMLGRTGNAQHEINVVFDPDSGLIRTIEASRTFQGKVAKASTTFSDSKVNPAFKADFFTYVAAPGVKAYAPPIPPPTFGAKPAVGAAPYPLVGTDLEGRSFSWDKYKGKVVLLDFWATWCGPCIQELPNVFKNYAKYQAQGFEVVGVSLDEDKNKLVKFIKAHDMKYPNFFDGKKWQNGNAGGYSVQGIPFSLLVGKDGKIVAIDPRAEKLEPAILAALAAK